MSIDNLRYRDNPDLLDIGLYVNYEKYTEQEVGMFSTSSTGFGSCSTVGEAGMRALLQEAKMLGGNSVKGVKFKHKFHWAVA